MKTTKKNYTRRKVVAGVAIFASLALIGTGFASFIISTNKPSEADGTIEIGAVEDKTVHFYNPTLSAKKIQFEPKADDTTGRVRYDGTNGEVLSTTLTFSIDNSSKAKAIHIDLEVPDALRTAADSTHNYITLPSIADYEDPNASTKILKGLDITLDGKTADSKIEDASTATTKEEGSDQEKTVNLTEGKKISYTFSFGWGTAFNSLNPGEYYDTDHTGKAVSDDDMKTALNTFHGLMDKEGDMKVNLSVVLN